MTATVLKDPRRYFEAVQTRATEASAPHYDALHAGKPTAHD